MHFAALNDSNFEVAVTWRGRYRLPFHFANIAGNPANTLIKINIRTGKGGPGPGRPTRHQAIDLGQGPAVALPIDCVRPANGWRVNGVSPLKACPRSRPGPGTARYVSGANCDCR